MSSAVIPAAAHAFLAAWLHSLFPARVLVCVVEGVKEQETFHQDLGTWLSVAFPSPLPLSARNLFFPAWEILPHEGKLPHADVISERLETLIHLSRLKPGEEQPLVCATTQGLMQRTFPPAEIIRRTRVVRKDESCNPLDLVEWLEDQGYEPEAQVTQKGEIALRGGILDLYPLTSPWPIRLEFFGDQLESLRYFDPVSQISRETVEQAIIPPAGELGLLKQELLAGRSEAMGHLIDYLPANTVFLLSQPDQLLNQSLAYEKQFPANDSFLLPWEDALEKLQQERFPVVEIFTGGIPEETSGFTQPRDLGNDEVDLIELPLSDLEAFRPIGSRLPDPQVAEAQRRDFFLQLERWQRLGYQLHIFCNNSGERDRFLEIWQEGEGRETIPLHIHLGTLSRGFLSEPGRLVVVTDAEIFGRYKIQRPRRLKSPHAAATRSMLEIDFTELEEGDYVVHLQHGIGRYRGLQRMPGNSAPVSASQERVDSPEFLVIEYAPARPEQEPPKLYVPITEAHLVSKYVGTGKARPPLNTLGGNRWAKTKEQAEAAVRDVASDLLSIQAARQSQPGHPFPPDTSWQREFESSFIFEETPDQHRAIQETKTDMESARPMDRLICGDVGFGKTEVAIRAAFKGVMSGKQVAVLVPTTVLAQQHFNTFRERMADYPVKIELLSRFRTRKEQQNVLHLLANGGVDIVIGTHRLVQEDIQFKDLGLVVIDEEQRFGVMHKEKFKMLRKLVDVLTLSATPIPRTLYLALTGARDMSTIETPPQDRLPVETVVTEFDERVIRDAIQRELNREGQVFYLHNRVLDIEAVAMRLRKLVPQARLVIGHGQMDADQLEEVMASFVNGEADVLLSTTIIESGLDIPNANTIIIDRADRFGLSDLYQLRGRVGRYKHQAYAYLLLPRHAALVADARKRLSAIKQYSTLGSGFKIAMRDLEIRGAGNLLGSQQSGHITAVGFDLYCRLLKQSVSALKGEKVKPRRDVQLRLDFIAFTPEEEASLVPVTDLEEAAAKLRPAVSKRPATLAEQTRAALLPFSYISQAAQRVEIYRRLAELEEKISLQALERELRDRFGPLPPEVDLLLKVTELKLLAGEKRVNAIETREGKVMLTRNQDYIMVGGKFPRLSKATPKARLGEIKKLLLALA